MCDVTGYIYVTQKKKKKPTSTGERNQTKKKKKRSKKCQKAKPKSRFYKPTNHGEEYKYYNCLVTRKASYPTERHDHALYFLICLGKKPSEYNSDQLQCKWNPESSFLRRKRVIQPLKLLGARGHLKSGSIFQHTGDQTS